MPLSSRDLEQTAPVMRPFATLRSHVPIMLTRSTPWRLVMAFLMVTTFVVGMWAGIASQAAVAYAMSQQQASLQSAPPAVKPRRGTRPTTTISPCPALTGTPTINGNVDGLGTVGYYTMIKQQLDDRLQMQTNVANGNFVVQSTDVYVKGTGIDLDIVATYNAQSSASGTLGANWNLSVGNGVSLSFSGNNVTLHGSSGFSAPYNADSNSYQGYDEPAGLDATLLNVSSNPVNGADYVLIFQKSSECFGFNGNGQEMFDQDKNGHQITFAYNGSNQLISITDTQNRLTSFKYDSSGRVSKITDPIGRTVQFSYDGDNNLQQIMDMDGNPTTFGYSGHDLTSITDPDGNPSTSISYLTGDKVGQITDATGAVTSFDYDNAGESDCSFNKNPMPTTTPPPTPSVAWRWSKSRMPTAISRPILIRLMPTLRSTWTRSRIRPSSISIAVPVPRIPTTCFP